MRIIKKRIRGIIKDSLVIACLIITALFFMYKLISYENCTEEYSYELEEIKSGTYVIYNTVSSTVPAHNYEVATICYNDQIHMFQGTVNICQTNDKPYVEIISRPHMNYSDVITIHIPKGTVEFSEGVGVR